MSQYDQNARNAVERCAPSGPQKHTTKESDGFHNHSNLLAMFLMNVPWLDFYRCCECSLFLPERDTRSGGRAADINPV